MNRPRRVCCCGIRGCVSALCGADPPEKIPAPRLYVLPDKRALSAASFAFHITADSHELPDNIFASHLTADPRRLRARNNQSIKGRIPFSANMGAADLEINDFNDIVVRDDADAEELAAHHLGAKDLQGLKRAADGHTILIPQPNDDEKNPLNWSMRKKWLVLLSVSLASVLPDYGSATGAVTLVPQGIDWGLVSLIFSARGLYMVCFYRMGTQSVVHVCAGGKLCKSQVSWPVSVSVCLLLCRSQC